MRKTSLFLPLMALLSVGCPELGYQPKPLVAVSYLGCESLTTDAATREITVSFSWIPEAEQIIVQRSDGKRVWRIDERLQTSIVDDEVPSPGLDITYTCGAKIDGQTVLGENKAGIDASASWDALEDQEPPVFTGIIHAENIENKIRLRWERHATDNATNASNMTYLIFRGLDTNIDFNVPYGSITGEVSFDDSEVQQGQRYYYAVRAQDASGNIETNQVIKDVVASPSISFVGIKSATAISDSAVEIEFDEATGGLGDLYYLVYESSVTEAVKATTSRKVLINGLSRSRSYTYKVHAADSQGSEITNDLAITVETMSHRYPAFLGIETVESLTGSAGNSQLRLTWQQATPVAGKSIGYRAYMGTSSDTIDFSASTCETNLTQCTITGLSDGRKYFFAVRAHFDATIDEIEREEINTISESAFTTQIQPISFAGLRTATQGTGQNYSDVYLSWLPASGSFDLYNIYHRTEGGSFDFNSPLRVVGANQVGFSLTASDGLQELTTNYFIVRAASLGGDEDSNTVERSTNLTPSPPVFTGPTSLKPLSGAAALTSVELGWDTAIGSFTGYRIFLRYPDRVDGSEDFDFSLRVDSTDYAGADATAAANLQKVEITGLDSNERICFSVRAIFKLGSTFIEDSQNEDNIAEKCLTLEFVEPQFSGLASLQQPADSADSTKLTAVWNEAIGAYDHYRIYWSTDRDRITDALNGIQDCNGICSTTTVPSDETSKKLANLNPGTEYFVAVRAGYSPINGAFDSNVVVLSESTHPVQGTLKWIQHPVGERPWGQDNMPSMRPKPTVELVDDDGNRITFYSGEVELELASGSGYLSGATATLESGIATFDNLKFFDTDVNNPTEFTIRATSLGQTTSDDSDITENTESPCANESVVYRTTMGGCLDQIAGVLFWQKYSSNVSDLNGSEVFAVSFDGDVHSDSSLTYRKTHNDQKVEDQTPTTGYCWDGSFGGYTDWKGLTMSQFFRTIYPARANNNPLYATVEPPFTLRHVPIARAGSNGDGTYRVRFSRFTDAMSTSLTAEQFVSADVETSQLWSNVDVSRPICYRLVD